MNRDTEEILLGIAYVLEVSKQQRGPQHKIFRLVPPSASSNPLAGENRSVSPPHDRIPSSSNPEASDRSPSTSTQS